MDLSFKAGTGEFYPGVHPLFGGWDISTSGKANVFYADAGSAAGNKEAGVQLQYETASISKKIDGLAVGQNVVLSFNVALRDGFDAGMLVVYIDDTTIGSISVNGTTPTPQQLTFTPTKTSYVLQFQLSGKNSIIFISGLTDGTAAPETPTNPIPPVNLPPPQQPAAFDGNARISFVGDSFTAGTKVNVDYPDSDPVSACKAELLKYPNIVSVEAFNYGNPGTNTNFWRESLAPVLLDDSTITCICLGINDGWMLIPKSTYEANIQIMIYKLKGAGKKVILNAPPIGQISPGLEVTEATRSLTKYYGQILRNLSKQSGVYLGDTAFALIMEADKALYLDEVHPNHISSALAGQLWARPILDVLGV